MNRTRRLAPTLSIFIFLAGFSGIASAQTDTTPPVVSIIAPAAGSIQQNTSRYFDYKISNIASTWNVSIRAVIRNGAGMYWQSEYEHNPYVPSGWVSTEPTSWNYYLGDSIGPNTWRKGLPISNTLDNFPTGTYTLEVTVRDANRFSTKVSRSFILDVHTPSFSITSPKSNWQVSSFVPITGTAVDEPGGTGIGSVTFTITKRIDGYYKYWDGSDWVISPSASIEHKATLSGNGWKYSGPFPSGAKLPIGDYYLDVSARDKAGNSDDERLVLKVVRPNAIDFASFTAPAVPASSWKPLYDYGIRSAVSRAWGGRGKDVYSGPQLRDARINGGISTAAYVFLNFDNGAIGGPTNQTGGWQVEQALSALGSEAVNMSFVAIDVEDGYKGNMTTAARVQRIQEAVQAVRAAGLRPIIYSRKVHWDPMTGSSQAFKDLPLWSVRYATAPSEELADLDNDRDGPFATNGQAFGGWTFRLGKQYAPVHSATDVAPTAKSLMQQFGLKTVDANIFSWQLFSGWSKPLALPLISVAPNLIPAGGSATGTVTVNGSIPASGITVTLTSSNTAAATVPAQVLVPGDTKKATFTIKAPAAAPNSQVTITGAVTDYYGQVSETSATLTVGSALLSIAFPATTAVGGKDVVGTLTLNANTPAGGAVIKLSSSNLALAKFLVPGTTNTTGALNVTVPAGQKTATFTLKTAAVTANKSVTVTGRYNMVRSRNLTLTPPPAVLTQFAVSEASSLPGDVNTSTLAESPVVKARPGSRAVNVQFPVGLNPKATLDLGRYKVEINSVEMPVQSISYDADTRTVRLVLYRWPVNEGDDVVVSWEGLRDQSGRVLSGDAMPLTVAKPEVEVEPLDDPQPGLRSTPNE